jgi:drug/metabolite transporter (DMT)-like permease
VFLAVLAERFFGFHLGRRQWAGVMITAAGLAVLGVTAPTEGPQHASLAALVVFGEPVGSGPLGITARVLAFCLIIAGAAFMPAPVRAIADQHAQALADV